MLESKVRFNRSEVSEMDEQNDRVFQLEYALKSGQLDKIPPRELIGY